MSFFFAICTILFYGLCQALARTSVPSDKIAYQKNFIYDDDHTAFVDTVIRWTDSNEGMSIHQETDYRIVVHQNATLLNFGFFYYFEFNQANESMIITLGVQPKLISTGAEAEKILDRLSDHFYKFAKAA